MSASKKKQFVKNSNKKQSSGLLQALQKLISNQGGSISYVYIENRAVTRHSVEQVQHKSMLHVNLTADSVKGKSEKELLDMFYTTKWDLGADYFIID